jgi:hypothetical protein
MVAVPDVVIVVMGGASYSDNREKLLEANIKESHYSGVKALFQNVISVYSTWFFTAIIWYMTIVDENIRH